QRAGPPHSRFTANMIRERIAERDAEARTASNGEQGYDIQAYARAYDEKVPEVSKALVILHVPVLGLALMLIFRHTRRYYAEHVVVALHLFAFMMAAILIVSHAVDLMSRIATPSNEFMNWAVRAILLSYFL